MGDKDLEYSDTVKYLGILLDRKLTFGAHIRDTAKKATRLLHCYKTSVGQLWGPSLFLMRWILKVTYKVIVWANKATHFKKQLDRVHRLVLLAMAHVHRSTPTTGVDAILDVMPLDLFVQSVAVQAVCRVQGKNQSRWNGIGCDCLGGHLFWSNQLLKQVDLGGGCTNTEKRAIEGLFHDRWKVRWKHLTTCGQTKYWMDIPSSIGIATAWTIQPSVLFFRPRPSQVIATLTITIT